MRIFKGLFGSNESETLLSPSQRTIGKDAATISALLVKLPFDETLRNALQEKKDELKSGSLTAENYFKDADVLTAMRQLIKEQSAYLPNLLRTFWHQNHTFSAYEKTALILSAMTLAAAMVFITEVLAFFDEGKPKFEDTANALRGQCNPMPGYPGSTIIDTCLNLNSVNTSAVFDFSRSVPFNGTPQAFIGSLNDTYGMPAGIEMQEVKSWLLPSAWYDAFLCHHNGERLLLTGHTYHGDISSAREKAANGFPIMQMDSVLAPSYILSNATEAVMMITVAIITFCELIKEGGGRNPLTGDFTQSFGELGDTFERGAYFFAFVYAGLAGIAALTSIGLFLKAAISKWESSSETRQNDQDARLAISLWQKHEPLPVVSTQPADEHSLTS